MELVPIPESARTMNARSRRWRVRWSLQDATISRHLRRGLSIPEARIARPWVCRRRPTRARGFARRAIGFVRSGQQPAERGLGCGACEVPRRGGSAVVPVRCSPMSARRRAVSRAWLPSAGRACCGLPRWYRWGDALPPSVCGRGPIVGRAARLTGPAARRRRPARSGDRSVSALLHLRLRGVTVLRAHLQEALALARVLALAGIVRCLAG